MPVNSPCRFQHLPLPNRKVRLSPGHPEIRIIGAVALAAVWAGVLRGQPPRDPLADGTTTQWTLVEADCQPQVLRHLRLSQPACDQLRIRAGHGTSALVQLAIGPAFVIDELKLHVPLKADRAGLQVLARVVLPRTIDPQTDAPLTLSLAGPLYTDRGNWQTVTLSNLRQQLERQVRVLRSRAELQVDPREAAIERVFVNVFGGPGVTTVWLGDPAFEGAASGTAGESRRVAATLPLAPGRDPASRSLDPAVRLQGDTLVVQERPFFPRVIDHRGESWEDLKELGFNTIRLLVPVTADHIADAQRLDLWLVAPPPRVTSAAHLRAHFDRVLAWDVGGRLDGQSFNAKQAHVRALRDLDRDARRPILCGADAGLRGYSRCADILLHQRAVLGSSFELSEFAGWLKLRAQLARPGVPHWASIQTEALPAISQQVAAFAAPPPSAPPQLDPAQIAAATWSAVSGGMRGLHFESGTRLDLSTSQAKIKRLTLQSLNQRLGLIEPWLATGTSDAAARCDRPQLNATIIRTPRAALVVCQWQAAGAQFAADSPPPSNARVTVPGVPLSHEFYILTPGGVRLLHHQRVAGGTTFTVPLAEATALVMITGQPQVVASLQKGLRQQAPRAARTSFELAAALYQETLVLIQTVRSEGLSSELQRHLSLARDALGRSDTSLRREGFAAAAEHATRALTSTITARRALWQAATAETTAATFSSPLCTQCSTLPWHWQLTPQLPATLRASNVLPGGDFANAEHTRRAGWRVFSDARSGIHTQASFVHDDATASQNCLRLAVWPPGPNTKPLLETAPLWVNSPPVRVAEGQLVRIDGRVRIPARLKATYDGLMIFDSLGGPSLGLRLHETQGWQPFTVYRAAAAPADVQITFALTGVGDALIDDVTVRVLKLPRLAGASRGLSGL